MENQNPDYIIEMTDPNMKLANQMASEFETKLARVYNMEVSRFGKSDETMDFGTSIAIILGSATVTALAKGVADLLRKYNTSIVTIKKGDGHIIVKNVGSGQAEEIVKAFLNSTNKDT